MKTATFLDLIVDAKSGGSSGHTWYCPGVRRVFVERIPADHPRDWALGPKMVPGKFGVFLENRIHASGHSPYAIAIADTEAAACSAAAGCFRSQVSPWEQAVTERAA